MKSLTMGAEEKFCLRWNDFHQNIGTAFQDIRYEREFFDVTLASEDEQIQAHKVILSACSPFFRGILKKNKHDHPLVYLKGVRFTELLSLLNFMYNGEVNIAQAELNSFLAVAEDLKIKGLSQNGSVTPPQDEKTVEPVPEPSPRPNYSHKHNSTSQRSTYSPPSKRHRPNHAKPYASVAEDKRHKDDCLVPVKSEPGTRSVQEEEILEDVPVSETRALTREVSLLQDSGAYIDDYPLDEYEGIEDGEPQPLEGQDCQQLSNTEILKESREEFFRLVDPFMESTVGESGKLWLCKACGHNSRTKQHIMNHVEMKHSQGPGYSCPLCSVRVPSYQALHKHFSRNHNAKKKDTNFNLSSTITPPEYLDYAL